MWKSQQTKFLKVVIDKLVFESEKRQFQLLFSIVYSEYGQYTVSSNINGVFLFLALRLKIFENATYSWDYS